MKKLIIVLATQFYFYVGYAINIKIAILDNLQSQKLSSVNYVVNYLNGIKLAQKAAKTKGINIDYEYFPYNRDPLDILNQINKVKGYNPDIIIGPRFSDKFLLLKDYFSDTLVVSPLATAKQVYSLPTNFYTMTLPDKYAVEATNSFLYKYFPHPKHVFLFTTVDCISCVEISNIFLTSYNTLEPNTKINNYKFLADHVEEIDANKFLVDYESGDLIFTPNISYSSSVVISKATNFLARNNVIIIGGDQWGPADVSYVGKIKTPYDFQAYKIIPWSINEQSIYGKLFRDTYIDTFNKNPSSLISLITFETVMKIIEFADPKQKNQRKAILKNFVVTKKMVRNNTYSVYRVSKDNETLIDSISINVR